MFDKELYNSKLMSAEDAVKLVHDGDRVWVGLISSVCYTLAGALWGRKNELKDIALGSGQVIIPCDLICNPEPNPFTIVTPFMGPAERLALKNGRRVTFTSYHLSQVDLWMSTIMRASVAFISASLPDENGNVSFGPVGGSFNKYALETADRIILEINPKVPFVEGMDYTMNIKDATAIVETDYQIAALPEGGEIDEETQQICNNVLDLIPDGATIQLGIGGLSNAIGYGLMDRNDLGIHSEMMGDSMAELIKNGNVTNAKKGLHDGISVFAFAMGTKKLYDYLDHNPNMMGAPFPYVNDPRRIAQCNKMTSINTAMSINLYGEAAADSMGWVQQSAVGGQLDFVRGAQWSNGGKSIIAMSSSFVKKGVRQSKIALTFPKGTAVTTPRSDVQYVATEYGCVNLKNLTMDDRVRAMISLAHPDFRDELTQQAKDAHLI